MSSYLQGNLRAEERPELPLAAPTIPDQPLESDALPEYHGSREAYLVAISRIENEYGVYDYRLTDQMLGLGLTLKNQGEHGPAIESLKRALHLSRINEGLHSLRQVAILEQLVESYIATNDWENASARQAYLYQLQSRNYHYADPRLLDSLAKMVKWHLQSYHRNNSSAAIQHLVEAKRLNTQVIHIIEANYGRNDLRLDEALVRHAETNYELILAQAAWASDSYAYSSSPYLLGDRTVVRHTQRAVIIPASDPFADGRRALERRLNIMEAQESFAAERKFQAMVQLGDWYFIFNKRDSALNAYRDAQNLAAQHADISSLATEVFDRPHALDFEFVDEVQTDPAKQLGYVEVTFDVTQTGRARDVRVIESQPQDLMDSAVAKSVRDKRYRPRIVNGEPVETEGVTYRHIFEF